MRTIIVIILIFTGVLFYADIDLFAQFTKPEQFEGAVDDELRLESKVIRTDEDGGGNETLLSPMAITGSLRVDLKQGRPMYVLIDDYYYCYDKTNELIRVPAGFVYDMASIPRPAWVLYQPARFPEASLVHDWLYAIAEGKGTEVEKEMRTKADDILRSIIVESGRGERAAATVHFATTRFGGRGYGLPEDFQFWNFDTDAYATPRPKPASGYVQVNNCRNLYFEGGEIRDN
ncbi:MAG: DUF1353 domain-containing protein [Aquisalinus sp.]|nr:DUF1353 domain-containing protein [Aquisalinus sp.]